MRNNSVMAMLAVGCLALIAGGPLFAQEVDDDDKQGRALLNALARQKLQERQIESPTPFINIYHPDWPVRGMQYDHLETAPYVRTPRRAYRDSPEFRAWFRFSRTFSRRLRWPYDRTSPELRRNPRR